MPAAETGDAPAPRLYGMADEAERPAPAEGFRGERAPLPGAVAPTREVAVDGGRVLQVREESGVAFAEATRLPRAPAPASPSGRLSPRPVALATALALAAVLVIRRWAGVRSRREG